MHPLRMIHRQKISPCSSIALATSGLPPALPAPLDLLAMHVALSLYSFRFGQVGAIARVSILFSCLQATFLFSSVSTCTCFLPMPRSCCNGNGMRVMRVTRWIVQSRPAHCSIGVRRFYAGNLIPTTTITSAQSNTIKRIQTLLSKSRKRNEWQQVVVEGPRMVRDLYENPHTRPLLRQVIISQDKWDVWAPVFQQQLDTTTNNNTHNIQLLCATASVLQTCTDTVTNQGILAVCDMPATGKRSDQQEQQQQHPQKLWLVLDGVSDPGNVGTLLRSAWATGVAGVMFLPDSCDPWNAKAVRSAMGATFHVPLCRVQSWNECVEQFHVSSSSNSQQQVRIYAATMLQQEENDNHSTDAGTLSTSSIAHYDVDWGSLSSSASPSSAPAKSSLSSPNDTNDTPTIVALVIGSEGNGLTPPLRQAVQRGEITPVHVPMEPGMESLNAAVCGSVILFEYYRQVREQQRHDNRNSTGNSELTCF